MPPTPTTHIYKSIDGCDIHADVYRQPGQGNPAILWLHGGMLMAGGRADGRAEQFELYLAAGYTVISADYRLAPETKLPGIIADLQDAYAWMRGEAGQACGIDPDRIAVIGHSAGGYLTLLAGQVLTPLPRALVSFYGYSDVDGAWYSRPDPYYSQRPAVTREDALASVGQTVISVQPAENQRGLFYLYCRQQGLWPNEVAGIDPHQFPEAYDAFDPIRNVSVNWPPTLLIHGLLDTDVPHEQSAQLARALEPYGDQHEFISLTDYGHAFEIGDGSLDDPVIAGVFDRVVAFLNRHTAPRAAA